MNQNTRRLLADNLSLDDQALANLLVEQTAKSGGGDDMTVLVASLCQPETQE